MYAVQKHKDPITSVTGDLKDWFVVRGGDNRRALFGSEVEKDCNAFAWLMNWAEKQMRIEVEIDAALAYEKEEAQIVHLSVKSILGPTYCGIPFDHVPHSSTMINEDVTCQKCLRVEKLALVLKNCGISENAGKLIMGTLGGKLEEFGTRPVNMDYIKDDKSCNENKVNFREFI